MRTLLVTSSLMLLACQSEPVSETSQGPAGGPAGPALEAGDPGPDGGGPDRDAPVTARLEGSLVYDAFAGGQLQVDVVGERDGSPQVVGMERYEQPGPFRIAVRGDFETVDLIVYVDVDGDGPSAGDLRVEYAGNPISVAGVEVVEGLTVDLAAAEAQDGTPKDAEGDEPAGEGEQTPPPEGEPDPTAESPPLEDPAEGPDSPPDADPPAAADPPPEGDEPKAEAPE